MYRTQADAIRDARQFIWGDVTFAKREWVTPKTRPDVSFFNGRVPVIAVSANVNGRLVVIHFDSYGRLDHEGVVVLDKIQVREG